MQILEGKQNLAFLGLTELTVDELECIIQIIRKQTIASFATDDDALHTYTALHKLRSSLALLKADRNDA